MNILEYMSVGENEKPLDRIATDGGFFSIFRTVACVGDSLSSGEFESKKPDGTKGYHDYYEYSWGQFMARSAGNTVYNFSRGGMTAKVYMESFAQERGFWDKDKAAQAYIIALGVNDIINQGWDVGSIDDIDVNDWRNNKQTFAGYYAQIIQRYKEIQPRAKFFLVAMPRHNNEKDEKRKAVRDLLERLTKLFNRTYLIDLYTYAPVNDEAYAEKYRLGHMNAMGYILTARMIESYIDYIVRTNMQDFNQVGFIGTDLYYNPED
ncbi:MAG: SGNH/GDSL hydrolase family protein [Clostridia bacterium]|nr:SGNH/GDSL hydrolase family protein [Clostridia bacterium]